ncbi:MAG: FliH/SctL family protein [Porcipelethomonas sp.]
MRKVIKPEDIRSDRKVIKIPDVEFEPEPLPENPEAEESVEQQPEQPVLTPELREQITEEIREELAGELGRRRIAATQECGRLVHDAKQEAETIIAQANAEKNRILSDAEAQSKQLMAQAYSEGSKKGFEEKKTLLDNLAVYISHSVEEIKRERNRFFEEYSRELKHLAVDICEKIISQKIEDDDMVMYGVIKDAVRYVRDAKWVKAEVSSELSGYIDSLEKELQDSGQSVEFILSEGVPRDTCILNTSSGLVVATLSEQIRNLREFIDSLDKGDSDEGKP